MPALQIRDVFTESQKGLHSHGKLIKNLKKIYDVTPIDEFWGDFMYYLKYSMVVFKREPVVERTIEFAAKFATSLVQKGDEKDETVKESLDDSDEEEDEMHPFLQKFFSFLLDSHKANDRAVRFRVCQMINKLLNSMGEGAAIDDDLYDRIAECMLQRLRDKFPVVRVHAVLAMTRLQDPRDADCPVINSFLFLLSCDTNPDVRRAVLSCIAASTKTLPSIVERTRDTKDAVRKLAYEVIAEKIHIKALTIAQRVQLLQDGLNDREEMVRDACSSRLLQAWLRIYEGNIIELLKCLDVENSLDTSTQALKCMLKKAPIAEVVANFQLLNDELVLVVEELSPEAVVYWRCLVEFLIELGTEGEEHLETLLPTGTNYAAFIKRVVSLMKGEKDIDIQLQNEFMLEQLLLLAASIDLSDEVGRRNMHSLVKWLLAEEEVVTHTLVKPLLALYVRLQTQSEPRVNELIEVISDIRMPITTVQSQVAREEQRRIELKIAKVRVDLNQLREELDSCIKGQDFTRAAEIKAQVEELETTKSSLLDETMPQQSQERVEKTDPATLLKCLTITAEMLQDISFKRLLPSLQTLIHTLILPGVQNADPAVRNLAVKALGLCCVIDADAARTHLLLFIQASQLDVDAVKVTALQVIFDLLLTFGMDAFQVETTIAEDLDNAKADTSGNLDDSDNTAANMSGASDAADDSFLSATQQPSDATSVEEKQKAPVPVNVASILTVLVNLLESEVSEVRSVAAEGLAKLLLAGRVVSERLLTRLVLLWYNPITEEDNYLRHCLGAFFPLYAFVSRSSQAVVEAAVLPILRTLFAAPATSPLADVSDANVADFLVQLTNRRHLLQHAGGDDGTPSPHDNLALSLCAEVLREPNSFNVRLLCKMLTSLELSEDNVTLLTDLRVLSERMLKEVKDTSCVKVIEKFQCGLLHMLTAAQQNQQAASSSTAAEEHTAGAGDVLEDSVFASPRVTSSTTTQPPVTGTGQETADQAERAMPEENKENEATGGSTGSSSTMAGSATQLDSQSDAYVTADEATSEKERGNSAEDFVLETSLNRPAMIRKASKKSSTAKSTSTAKTKAKSATSVTTADVKQQQQTTATSSRRTSKRRPIPTVDSDPNDDDSAFASPVLPSRRTTRARRSKASTAAAAASDTSVAESPATRRSTRKR